MSRITTLARSGAGIAARTVIVGRQDVITVTSDNGDIFNHILKVLTTTLNAFCLAGARSKPQSTFASVGKGPGGEQPLEMLWSSILKVGSAAGDIYAFANNSQS